MSIPSDSSRTCSRDSRICASSETKATLRFAAVRNEIVLRLGGRELYKVLLCKLAVTFVTILGKIRGTVSRSCLLHTLTSEL